MPWPKQKDLKQAGALCTIQTETAYHAYLMSLLTRVLGWTAEDADAICKAAHAAHLEKKTGVHAYNKLLVKPGRTGGRGRFFVFRVLIIRCSYIGYGRKPLA